MSGNPREHVKEEGFWDGGAPAQSRNDQSAGRTSGQPGSRNPKRVGIRTDLDFPADAPAKKPEGKR